MEEPEFKIPIEEPIRLFKQHLELEHNKRIIFSAPFGVGKTYFLDKFFKVSEEKESYKVLHLFPVNYSVSSNEDVFELIKFDILFQLLEDEDLVIDTYEFTTFFKSQFFFVNNAEKFGEWILKRFGKTGKSLVAYAKALEKLVNEYKKFEAEVVTNSDADRALNFLLEIKEKKGIAYEEDAITKLIQSFLQQLCDDEKKSVLVIDDLDRIDPEHIFRLLNVFAAHFDIGEENTNKFGFDKVIFVCDISNIRNIFHAKYGADTDFSGYIDKFYSTEVFSFNNIKATIEFISDKAVKFFYEQTLDTNTIDNYSYLDIFIQYILELLVFLGVLNNRTLKRFSIQKLQLRERTDPYLPYLEPDFNYMTQSKSYLSMIFDVLSNIYGDGENLSRALEKAKRNSVQLHYINSRFGFSGQAEVTKELVSHILPFIDINKKTNHELTTSFINSLNIQEIERIGSSNSYVLFRPIKENFDRFRQVDSSIILTLLESAYEFYKKVGYFNN